MRKLEEDDVSNNSESTARCATPAAGDNANPTDNNDKTNGKPPVIKKKVATNAKKLCNDDPLRFEGIGLDFKAKLIGVQDVVEARGDQMCQEAMMAAKAIVKNAGQHKHRIVVNVSIEGIKIKDEKNGQLMDTFAVQKISFIARDTTDTRAFGFVYGTPENKHKFYGIKTEQKSDTVVLAIRDMFHVVYEMKKRQLEDAKKESSGTNGADNVADHNANDTTKGPAVDNLLDLEVAFEGMKENLGRMSSWEAFDTTSNSDSGSGGLAKGSSFSSNLPHSDFSQSGNWSVNSLLNDSSNDPFADVVNKSSSPKGPGQQPPAPQSIQDDLQQLFSLQQGTPVADPFAALRQVPTPFDSAGLFNHPRPLIQPPSQVLVSPPSFGLTPTGEINSTGGDPFDTSHVSQMLKQTSTPQHSSGLLGGFGVNVSQQPSAIRGDSSVNDSFFGSNSVFDSRIGVGMTSNVSLGRLGSDSLNQAWSESKFQSELLGSGMTSSSPMMLTPLKSTGPSNISSFIQPAQQRQKPPASVEEGLGVLCDIHNLDLSTNQTVSTPKSDPFNSAKQVQSKKPTINELLKGNDANTTNQPRFDVAFSSSVVAPPMHQSSSTPMFTLGSPPSNNPFVQQPTGVSTPLQSWNGPNNTWMPTATGYAAQPPIGYQMSMGFSGDLNAPPVAPRSSAGRTTVLPPPIQATNFIGGVKPPISCGSGSLVDNPFGDDFFN